MLECTSSQKQAAEAITALLRHNPTISAVVCYNEDYCDGGMVWFCRKQGGKAGKAEWIVAFEQQVSLAGIYRMRSTNHT
ncbi:hypothetical protein ACO2XV_22640 [Escherichia coli]